MRIQSDAESITPKRAESSNQLGQAAIRTGPRRFRWRAVIRAGQPIDTTRGTLPVAWHLADCSAPASAEAHCEVGKHLIAVDGNPDGHCLVGDVCPRCEEAKETAEPQAAPEPEVKAEPEPSAAAS
jgi:hypothetical protein